MQGLSTDDCIDCTSFLYRLPYLETTSRTIWRNVDARIKLEVTITSLFFAPIPRVCKLQKGLPFVSGTMYMS